MNAYASVRAVLVLLGGVLGGGMAGSPVHAGLVPFDDVVDVAAGLAHSSAVTGSGAVYCWGSNEYGQLGDGSSMDRVTPVQVTGLGSGMQAVSVGRDHSCALSQGGAVWCWGRNSFGQLGDGTAVQRFSPVPVSNLSSGVQAIAVGGSFSCALNASGGVLCWGANSFGSLGDGSTNNRAVPGLVWGMG
ncbi:MAG: RCC1 repeat-containing protein, partial [Gammaproteobacteria bacterium]|nr:RCC1 repeat-containing protein [Gammaproteobacteria bacterium]